MQELVAEDLAQPGDVLAAGRVRLAGDDRDHLPLTRPVRLGERADRLVQLLVRLGVGRDERHVAEPVRDPGSASARRASSRASSCRSPSSRASSRRPPSPPAGCPPARSVVDPRLDQRDRAGRARPAGPAGRRARTLGRASPSPIVRRIADERHARRCWSACTALYSQ